MNKELLKMAKKLSFAQDSEVIYGEMEGYVTTISEQADNTKEIFISLFVTNSETCDMIKNALSNPENKSKYSILNADNSDNHVRVVIAENSDKKKNLYAFCDWFFPTLRSLGVIGSNCCSKCKQQINNSEKVYNIIRNRAYAFHSSCAQKFSPAPIEQTADEYEYKEKPEHSHLGRGIIGALLGGLIGAILWGTIYSLGFFSSYTGLVIAFLAFAGYARFGGEFKPETVFMLIVITLFYLALGVYLGECFSLAHLVLSGSITNPEFKDWTLVDVPAGCFRMILTIADVRKVVVGNYVQALIFSIVGAIIYFVISLRKSK